MSWTFLTNHAHVLICIARDSEMRLREIADCVGITERAAHRIVCELEADGYLDHRRSGSHNVYRVHLDRPLRHEMDGGVAVGDVLKALLKNKREKERITR
jgi:DNA-binding Lrp family transcriptional regulator